MSIGRIPEELLGPRPGSFGSLPTQQSCDAIHRRGAQRRCTEGLPSPGRQRRSCRSGRRAGGPWIPARSDGRTAAAMVAITRGMALHTRGNIAIDSRTSLRAEQLASRCTAVLQWCAVCPAHSYANVLEKCSLPGMCATLLEWRLHATLITLTALPDTI